MTDLISTQNTYLSDLRRIYRGYGYSEYRINKFEEYDFYVNKKDFLASDNILTFTDLDGKLMALKPDVTLSIIKGYRKSDVPEKVFYNENVYRPGSDGKFHEIMQTGLECLGNTDIYCKAEVILLAIKSLNLISEDNVLDISHIGILSDILDILGLNPDNRYMLIESLKSRNIDSVRNICTSCGVSKDLSEAFSKIASYYGDPFTALEMIEDSFPEIAGSGIKEMRSILSALKESGLSDNIRFDFSIINDLNYYNGIVFKGYVKGIHRNVLSGGQYDRLLSKMKKEGGAIGFAIYMDLLDKGQETQETDADTVILYNDISDLSEVMKQADRSSKDGRVSVMKTIPANYKYGKIIKV